MPISVVLFDLDGTLVDTTYLHTVSWSQALAEAGRPFPMATIHPLIGMGGTELLTTLLGQDDSDISAAHTRHFKAVRDQAQTLPGAAQLVRTVHDRGARVAVVSSSKPEDAEALLALIASRAAIDYVIHSQDADRAKPEPDLFQVALARAAVGPDEALAVGDAEWDVRAAARAGVGTIGVVTGGTSPERLREAGALETYGSCQAILDEWSASPFSTIT